MVTWKLANLRVTMPGNQLISGYRCPEVGFHVKKFKINLFFTAVKALTLKKYSKINYGLFVPRGLKYFRFGFLRKPKRV